MASGKESPRQKMIGMMYLVLTALLALNVSKDILDAFIVVDNGLKQTNSNYNERNQQLYASFDLAKSVDPNRITPSWEKAQNIRKNATDLNYFIEKLQKELVAKTEKIPQEVADTLKMENIASKDNYDIPSNILIGDSEDGSGGSSRELKNRLDSFKKLLEGYILPEDKKTMTVDINTRVPANPENENWEMYHFYHRPLVACLTILSKFKNDVNNAESQMVDYLLKKNDAEMMKFDTIAAKVIPNSNYVLLGEPYQAEVFLAAFNKTQKPEIEVGNSPDGNNLKLPVSNGLGKYEVGTGKEGIFQYEGSIRLKSASNKEMSFPFKSEYIVARPALTVSADKMNVVYLGLDNPISVSVPGIPNERLTVSASNAVLTKTGNGKFNLQPKQGTNVDVQVMATMENGEKRNMGTMSFRIKRVPKPTAKFGELTESGNMAKNVVAIQKGLIAYYPDFQFAATPKVTSFRMTIISSGTVEEFTSTGPMLTQAMINRLQKLKKNERVAFEEINAVGPDGISVRISPITIKVI